MKRKKEKLFPKQKYVEKLEHFKIEKVDVGYFTVSRSYIRNEFNDHLYILSVLFKDYLWIKENE